MKKLCFIIYSLILVSNSFAQHSQELLEEINAIENALTKDIRIKGEPIQKFNLADRMEHYKVPGVSIAIVQDGKLKWAKGYGLANTESGKTVDVNTLFQAGSISKPVAALSALKLYEEGRLALDRDVNQYLKGWQIPDTEFTKDKKVTVEKLLTHTAGITVHGFPGYTQTDVFPEIIDVLNGKGNTDLISIDTFPDAIWRYSGGGYTIMEKVVEDISGLPLEEYMEKHILQQLDMTNSTYEQPISKKYQDNISAAYDGDGALIEGLWNNYPEQAAAGLWTTPSDLAKYCLEVQEIIKGKTDGVLSKVTIDRMLTKHKSDWGLGPSLQGEGDALIFKHGGKNAGFTNNLKAFVHRGDALIVMTNADNGGSLIGEISNAVSEFYSWGISNQTTIELIELSNTELEQYTGKYEFKAQGLVVNFEIIDNKLFTKTPLGNLSLVPLSKTEFMDLETGMNLEFLIGEKVEGIIVNGNFKLEKID